MVEFLSMGGYAQYVWTAFGVSFVALVSLYLLTRSAFRKATERTRRYVHAMQGERS